MGVVRTTLWRFVALAVFKLGYCSYFRFYPDPQAFQNATIAGTLYLVIISGEFWIDSAARLLIAGAARLWLAVSGLWYALIVPRGYSHAAQ